MQAVGNGLYVAVRQSRYSGFIGVEKAFHLLCLHVRVIVVVWLEGGGYAVLFGLDCLLCLVDGEVELGYERAVHPRLAHVVAELRPAVARQEEHYYRDGDYKQRHAHHPARGVSAACLVEFNHFAWY